MSNKVFIVTDGYYSDYRVVAAFSTEQKAKDYIELTSKYYMSCDKEYLALELDTPQDQYIIYGIYSFPFDKIVRKTLDTDGDTFLFEKWNKAETFSDWKQDWGQCYFYALPYSERLEDENVLKKAIYDRYAEYKAKQTGLAD